MTDQELRAMVLESIARVRRTGGGPPPADSRPLAALGLYPADSRSLSHRLFPVASGSEGDGACLIEPTIRCNHCGYCQSYGL